MKIWNLPRVTNRQAWAAALMPSWVSETTMLTPAKPPAQGATQPVVTRGSDDVRFAVHRTFIAAMQATGNAPWAALSTSGLRTLDLPDSIRDVIVLADGGDPDDPDRDKDATQSNAESLRRFHEDEVMPYFETRRREIGNRSRIREEAFGEALDPHKLERLGRYEVHLDRKLERTLTMLVRLRDLRRGSAVD